MENKTSSKIEKLVGSPDSIFETLKSEMENEFFNLWNDASPQKKKFRSMSHEYPKRIDMKQLEKRKEISINDKIWIGPEKKDIDPKTMDEMQQIFFHRFSDRYDEAIYYRMEIHKTPD